MKVALSPALLLGFAIICNAQEQAAKPVELDVLKAHLGVWDAEIKVWPMGLDAAAIEFMGVETNRPYGEHWIASDFDSEFMGQTMKVHAIVGYDLDKKQLVGTIIDHGPYSASMTGEYDEKSKTVTWITEAKDVSGKRMVQKTLVTQKSADERLLVLMVPGEKDGEFNKFMQITFRKRE